MEEKYDARCKEQQYDDANDASLIHAFVPMNATTTYTCICICVQVFVNLATVNYILHGIQVNVCITNDTNEKKLCQLVPRAFFSTSATASRGGGTPSGEGLACTGWMMQ